MKIIMKNSNIVFQKYNLDRDVIIPGKLTNSVTDGTTVNITVNKGMYLVTVPAISDISLQNYQSSYGYIYLLQRNGSNLYGPVGVSSYSIKYFTINVTEDNTQIGLFARADNGTNVVFHIKEIKLPDISTWNNFYTNTFNVTSGTGLYGFLQNEAHRFKPNHIYNAVISDTTKIRRLTWYLGASGSNELFLLNTQEPNLAIAESDVVSSNKTQVAAGDVIGTGAVTITIYEYDASDILQ